MKEFISNNALKLFIGGLFVIAIGITVFLNNYASQVQRSLKEERVRGTMASDTVQGDYTMSKDFPRN